ncbi:MAG: elongation factor P [bacterium]|nr:elongation factor P [bacterium]
MPSTTSIKKGIAINHKGQSWIIIEDTHVHPSRGSAFTRAKMRNLKTGQVLEETFRSGESVELADTARNKCQFLYKDGNQYHFMEDDTYDQFHLDETSIGDNKKYLLEGTSCYALHIDGNPVSIQLPPKMEFKVTQSPPGVKGDTATGGSKECTIETGTKIKVPLFIKEGEIIIVNTETGDYVSKA